MNKYQLAAIGCALSCLAGDISHPERLSNRRDIEATKPEAEDIDVWNLPLRDYPLLVRFANVRRVELDSREGTFATDDKLRALASLGLTNIAYVTLTNCRLITDSGVRALCGIKSLKGLGLEGTAITDVGCEAMASQARLTGVNVANCSNVTLRGIARLAASESLQEISFSADTLTQEEAVGLIGSFKNIRWCRIVDQHGKFDGKAIEGMGSARGIHVTVRSTGALQDKYGSPD